MQEFINFTKEQKDVAGNIDIVNYLRDQGEQLKREGRSYRWQRYTSVVITGSRWYRWKNHEYGNAIDLLREFYNYSFQDAVNILLSYANIAEQPIYDHETKEVEKKEFMLPEKNPTLHRVYGYLIKTRYINKEVIDYFVKKDLLYEDKQFHNAVFVGRDEKGIAKHAHKRAVYSNNGRIYRGNVESSDPRYSFHYKGSNNILIISEAPIDTLSRMSLMINKWEQYNYVSLCGLGMQALEWFVEYNPQINEFIICTDRDPAGIEGAERITDYLKEKGFTAIHIMKSNFKDDNEELKHRNKQSALPAIQHPNYILQERVIGNLKKMMANDKNRVVEHKDLIKAFMEMFYRGNDNKNNYSKMQEDFITITNCALHLAYQSIEASYPVTSKSTICNTLFEEYRSYKDKGSWRKRMERLKESFHEVKILRDTAVTGELLGKAYQRIANESMMMGMQCARELEQVIEPNQKLINQKEIKGYQSL